MGLMDRILDRSILFSFAREPVPTHLIRRTRETEHEQKTVRRITVAVGKEAVENRERAITQALEGKLSTNPLQGHTLHRNSWGNPPQMIISVPVLDRTCQGH